MVQPKQSDIAQAKEYLRRRVAAEVSMEHYLDRRLLVAAREIIEYAYSRNIPPTLFSFEYDPFLAYEVNRIIRRLMQEIEDYEMAMVEYNGKESASSLTPYINREINGFTHQDRLSLYADRFKQEVGHFIKAGLLIGLASSVLEKLFAKSYKQPYKNTIISDVEHHGFTAYPRLLTLTRHTIADAWMHADMEYHVRNGAIGFISRRGSNYPCQTCDDMAARFHTFAEPYPPYHPHCVCYAIPVYQPQNL